MKFMTMVKSAEGQGPPPPALMEAIAKLGEDAARDGVMVTMGGLYPSAAGARVRVASGKLHLTDGPFTEAKELIGGFAIFEVPSKKEAIAWTYRFMEAHQKHWPGWEGETEIRQMF